MQRKFHRNDQNKMRADNTKRRQVSELNQPSKTNIEMIIAIQKRMIQEENGIIRNRREQYKGVVTNRKE